MVASLTVTCSETPPRGACYRSSQNNDRSDKFDALAAVVETKADKALTERWLEASQQLHGELQTVHVRTQTLGQGMKVSVLSFPCVALRPEFSSLFLPREL
jgi:hypothetical protein